MSAPVIDRPVARPTRRRPDVKWFKPGEKFIEIDGKPLRVLCEF